MAKNSNIILSKNILIDKEGKNRLSYGNGAMLDLMRSQAHLVNQASNYSFIDSVENKNRILVGFTYNECLSANYIAFQNPRYSAKWFFAFIDKVLYNSDGSTIIEFTIDSFTTWYDMFKDSMKPCYVIREHTNDDSIGANLLDENLSVGEVQTIISSHDESLSSYSWIALLSAWRPESKTGYDGISIYQGTVYGKSLCFFQNNIYGWTDLFHYLRQTNADAHIGDVTDMFIVPYAVVNQAELILHEFQDEFDLQTYKYYTSQYTDSSKVFESYVDKQYSWLDYTPKNNKLYCYPYNYLYVSNNNGSHNIYKYEDFSTSRCQFDNELTTTIGVSGRLVPRHYKGQDINDDESLPLGKYPTCSWSADSYVNWLTQNAVNIPTQMIGLIANGVGTVATGNVAGAPNLAQQIGGMINQFYQAQLLPPITGGNTTGDVVFTSKRNHFEFRCMRAKVQFLRIIDDYFSRFGYKTDRVKIPNITGRQNFNYIEIGTGERFAYGEVPPEAINEINQMARNGLTIWHNHANVGNFNVSNSIV